MRAIFIVLIRLAMFCHLAYAGMIHEISFEESLKRGFSYEFKKGVNNGYDCENTLFVSVSEQTEGGAQTDSKEPQFTLEIDFDILDNKDSILFSASSKTGRIPQHPHQFSICFPNPESTRIKLTVYYMPRPTVWCENDDIKSCKATTPIPMCPHNLQFVIESDHLKNFTSK